MATSCHLLNHVHIKGWQSLKTKKEKFTICETLKCPTRRNPCQRHRVSLSGLSGTHCLLGVTAYPNIELFTSKVTIAGESSSTVFGITRNIKLNMPQLSEATSDIVQNFLLADLDPATAKLVIGILGPFLSAFGFLFILRIVMSWYPKLPVGKFPYVIAYAPTEPFLIATRKLIPPLAGVDVTPVVWFGLISFLNEILVGPQGLLVLVSQQVS
ncbi:hypothetical protein SLE2022_295300 [Rubroshorea leprosula]